MTPRAVVLVEGTGDAAALETLARRRGTPPAGVAIVVLHGYTDLRTALRALRRFLSARPQRTIRYATLFAAALEPGELPDPLRRVLADVGL